MAPALKLRRGMQSTPVKCLCEYEQTVLFRKPKLFSTVTAKMKCDNCGSLWTLTLKKNPSTKKGQLAINVAPISLTQKCAALMKKVRTNNEEEITMTTNLTALQTAIKFLVDAGKDTVVAIQPGQSALGRLLDYENLGNDLMLLIPQIGDIPTELTQLQLPDVVTLTQAIVTDLGVTEPHAHGIIAASLKLLNDVLLTLVPDVEALIESIKVTLPATPAPVTPATT